MPPVHAANSDAHSRDQRLLPRFGRLPARGRLDPRRAQEERFTRIKHDSSFPHHAIRFCLSRATGPLDAVVYYEKPLLKFERILRTAFSVAPGGFGRSAQRCPSG